MSQARIIITIDDIGYNPFIDESAIKLIETLVNRIAIFTTYQDIKYIKNYISTDKVGIHLNLTSGKCLGKSNTTLTDKHGNYFKPIAKDICEIETFLNKYIENHINSLFIGDIINELQLQLNTFKKSLGTEPSFITFHHDMNQRF